MLDFGADFFARAVVGMDSPPKTTLAQTELDGVSVGVLGNVVDLTGRIRGMSSRMWPDKFEIWGLGFVRTCGSRIWPLVVLISARLCGCFWQCGAALMTMVPVDLNATAA
jgi:hypothetical protein